MVDKLKLLSKRLKNVAQSLDAMKKTGINQEILMCWLRTKTGLPKKDLQIMLRSTEEFYDKLICEASLEAL